MPVSLAAMSPEFADDAVSWLGGSTSGEVPRLVDDDHVAILLDGALVGVAVVAAAARVPGGPPADGVTDLWIAIRPEHRGRRLATRGGELVLESLRMGGHTALRATVATEDEAARRLSLRLGFLPRVDDEGAAVVVLERELLA